MPRTQFNEPIQREITLGDGVTKVMQGLANVQVSVYKINEDGTRGALATLYARLSLALPARRASGPTTATTTWTSTI
jgi:hypothetical protein